MVFFMSMRYLLLLVLISADKLMTMADNGNPISGKDGVFDLESVRKFLTRQEDTIVFSLIERARFPMNLPTYDQSLNLVPGFHGSLAQFFVKETEALQAKASIT